LPEEAKGMLSDHATRRALKEPFAGSTITRPLAPTAS
jgi:hypothetical protein